MDKVKKVVLFGAGKLGKHFVEKNDDLVKENFVFCDNKSSETGKIISGLRVISFDELRQLYKEKKVGRIVITAGKVYEIFEQCLINEIRDCDIYFYDMTTNSVKSSREVYSIGVFSQDGEETFLREFFSNKEKGFYVDVGAYHPFRFSNTAWAYERGWTGINIEPNIDGYKKFIWMRSRDINLNCGISNKEDTLSYYEFEEGAYNTFCYEEILKNQEVKVVSQVKMKRLDSIFNEYHVGKIDFLDIDVEGYELNVLKSNDWDLYRPTIILCEQKIKFEKVIESDICIFMQQKGYDAICKYNRSVIYKESRNGK